LVKKTRSSPTVDADSACSNGGSEKDKYSDDMPHSEGRIATTQFLCHRGG